MAKFKIYGYEDKYGLDEIGPVSKTTRGLKGALYGGKVTDLNHLLKRLEGSSEVIQNAFAAALFDESVRVMKASQKIVPVDSRDLKRSAIVKPPRTLKRPETSLSYNTPYALYQHEHHAGSEKNPGPRAKYLEGPMQESANGLDKRLARGLRKHARKGTKVSSLKPKTYKGAR